MVKDFLPENIKITQECADLVRILSIKFVNHLSAKANKCCLIDEKKSITQIHVAQALQSSKLESYLAKILKNEDGDMENLSGKELKDQLNQNLVRRQKRGKQKMTEEELQELKAK